MKRSKGRGLIGVGWDRTEADFRELDGFEAFGPRFASVEDRNGIVAHEEHDGHGDD